MNGGIISKSELNKLLKNKEIIITPMNPANISNASIDLTLGNKFRKYKLQKNKIHLSNDIDYRDYSYEIDVPDGDYIEINPGETILGYTKEKITLPGNICAFLEGRSRFARMGITVHITAPFMNPGISNCQMLEIFNASPFKLCLYPNLIICQMIFIYTTSDSKYAGKYKDQ